MEIIGAIDICGDTHFDLGAINYWISNGNVNNLIHVGDFITGDSKAINQIGELGNKLNKANKWLFVSQGNHCNPLMHDDRIYGGEYGGVKLLKRGTIANWNNENILFCGGAISIDRNNRIPGISWWENEEFVPCYPKIPIDHVITHVSIPEVNGVSVYSPNVLHWSTNDGDLIHDLMMEQQIVRNWINELIAQGHPIKTWHYGHYHQSIQSEYNGIKCRCLAINEIAPFNRKPYT